MNTQEIRQLVEQDKLVIGYNEVRQAIIDKAVSSVLIATNAEQARADAMKDYCLLSEVTCETTPLRNDQVGTACRKPFSISFIAVKN
ncbi:MAG: ribosomal L7Ae/L30e/S12e/Gadd45 family protein [Candidatus Woesearchaeota archaeon]